MAKGNKSDKIAQKKNNYQVIKESKDDEGPEKIPTFACDKKRCLNGRCGSCWMVALGMSIAIIVFIILYIAGVIGFDFTTSGTETLYDLITDSTDEPTSSPTYDPTGDPTVSPSSDPTVTPTYDPTAAPTISPSGDPTADPTMSPTDDPTTLEPTVTPTGNPTGSPSVDPTTYPTETPTKGPTHLPTSDPTVNPTADPTTRPTSAPTVDPTTSEPTTDPTSDPTALPTTNPSHNPTTTPTTNPTSDPTTTPTANPTSDPTTLPTDAPTDEPTADPTSERRRNFDMGLNSNIVFLIADGNLFNNTEFETPAVDNFLKEGYTLNNLRQGSALGSLIAGKVFRSGLSPNQGLSSWAELLRSKGYSNYYYGSWMADSEDKASTPAKQGWDFYDEDVIMEKVQSRLQTIKDDKWFIAVNWTISHKDIGLMVNGSKTTFDRCSRYFKVDGSEANYHQGLSCQCTIEYDSIFGKVKETLESTRQWMNTIVVFVVAGQQKNIFSMGGGALPANFLSKKNRYLFSMLDVVRKILALSGFSDLELRSLTMDGFPAFRMKQ